MFWHFKLTVLLSLVMIGRVCTVPTWVTAGGMEIPLIQQHQKQLHYGYDAQDKVVPSTQSTKTENFAVKSFSAYQHTHRHDTINNNSIHVKLDIAKWQSKPRELRTYHHTRKDDLINNNNNHVKLDIANLQSKPREKHDSINTNNSYLAKLNTANLQANRRKFIRPILSNILTRSQV